MQRHTDLGNRRQNLETDPHGRAQPSFDKKHKSSSMASLMLFMNRKRVARCPHIEQRKSLLTWTSPSKTPRRFLQKSTARLQMRQKMSELDCQLHHS